MVWNCSNIALPPQKSFVPRGGLSDVSRNKSHTLETNLNDVGKFLTDSWQTTATTTMMMGVPIEMNQ